MDFSNRDFSQSEIINTNFEGGPRSRRDHSREPVAVITAGRISAENVARIGGDRISHTSGAILDSAIFAGSYFEAVDFSMAVLTRASFVGASFEMNNMRACNLDGVQVDGALIARSLE